MRAAPAAADFHRCHFFQALAAGSVREGLAFTRRVLADWRLTAYPDLADSALLVTAELLGNAAVHAGGPKRLDLDLGVYLQIAVTDSSPLAPRRRTPEADQPHGRGLQIVDRLSVIWGHHQLDGKGKTVWADLEVPDARS